MTGHGDAPIEEMYGNPVIDPDLVFPNDCCPRCGAPVVWRVDHGHIMEQVDPGAVRGDGPPAFQMEFTCCTIEYRAEICGDRFDITAIIDPNEPDYEVTPGGF